MEPFSTFYQRSRAELSRVIAASRRHRATRAVLVATRDREHALSVVRQVAVESLCSVYHFSAAARRRWQPERLAFEACGGPSADPAELLRQAIDVRGGGVVILEDVLCFLRDQGGDRAARAVFVDALSAGTRSEGVVLAFLEPPESAIYVPAIVADQCMRFDVPMPRSDELQAIAREELSAAVHGGQPPVDVSTLKRWASLLAHELVGLTRTAARDALRDVLTTEPIDLTQARARLGARKAEHLAADLAMRVRGRLSEQEMPVGLDYLYDYLDMNRDRVTITGEGRARGVLLLGPPGTGKSMVARAIGQILDLPVIDFRIGALMNSLLGETERRFDQAFEVLEAMSPSCVHIDEIEKAFGDASGTERDGGTMVRCTGRLLSWLADNPNPNYIVATANSLRRLGSELGQTLTRRGRFDKIYFVDVPCRAARGAMLARWLAPHMADAEGAAESLADATEKFSGADLRGCVHDAVARATYQRRDLAIDDIARECERNRLRVQAMYDEFQELRRFAHLYCEPAGPDDTVS